MIIALEFLLSPKKWILDYKERYLEMRDQKEIQMQHASVLESIDRHCTEKAFLNLSMVKIIKFKLF